MRGKAGLVIGLAVGYVLGTRAGRKRYEQIKVQAEKLWNLDPVQQQVEKVKDFGASAAAAIPVAVWNGAVKVTRSVAHKAQEAASDTSEVSAEDAEKAARAAAKKVDDATSGS